MERTRVGYCGGRKADPTYRDLGDHTEAMQIDFDPKRVSYAELLAVFFDAHRPLRAAWSRQYRSAIFPANDAQMRAALAAREDYALGQSAKVHTDAEPLEKTRFYRAEDYHQKYQLRRHEELMPVFAGYSTDALTDSRAAARLNGWLAGYATLGKVTVALPELGLSERDAARVLAVVKSELRWREDASLGK